MTVSGPRQPARVMIDNDHQVLGTAPIGDLVDPDPDQPSNGSRAVRASPTTCPAIAPTVRQATRITTTTADFEVWVASQAT